MSSKQELVPEELIQTVFEIWNEGDLETVDEIYAEDCDYYDTFGEHYDRESLKSYMEMIRTAFPDFHVEEVQTVSEGDVVMCQYTFGGTMEGEFRGFEPTGTSFELHGIVSCRVEDGRIVEEWNAANTMAMAQQLGLLG